MPDLIETVENGIATLTLNRPERLNALSMDIRTGLAGSAGTTGPRQQRWLHRADRRRARAFCAGGDVKSMGERAAAGFEPRAAGIQFSNRIPKLMRTIPKTVIAMVNGVAVGAGLSMALACDLRIAARVSTLRNRISEDRPVWRLGGNLDADPIGRHGESTRTLSAGRHDHRG